MKKFCLYLRVSTQKQEVSGLSFEAQQATITRYLEQQGDHEVVSTHIETETGTGKRKRPQLKEALRICSTSNATLVVASLSRLARNVHFISGLVQANIPFIALDMPSMDKNMAYFMSIMAEWEADAISKRTKDALTALKARGVKLGPKFKKLTAEVSAPHRAKWNAKEKDMAFDFAEKIYPTIKFFKDKGLTNSQVAEELNKKNYPTYSGRGQWHTTTVQRCVARVQKITIC